MFVFRDGITGVPGRELLEEVLLVQLASARRERRPCAVIYADIEQLRRVNALLGDTAGDELLRLAALRMRAALRGSDTLGRVGGDELAAVAPGAGGDAAILVAEKVRRACTGWFEAHGTQYPVRVSVGSSVFPDEGDSVSELLRRAEAAMYRIKVADRQIFGASSRIMGNEYVLKR